MPKKPAQEELQQRIRSLEQAESDRMQSLFHTTPAAIVVHDADTKIIGCNPTAQELLGGAGHFLGKSDCDPAWKFFYPDEKEMPADAYPVSRVLATGEPLRGLLCGLYHTLKSNMLWVLVNADPVFDDKGNVRQIIVYFIDISDLTSIVEKIEEEGKSPAVTEDISQRKQIEGALRESRRKYQSIIEKSDDIIWVTDLDINTIYVSPSIEKKLGFTSKERKAQSLEAQLSPSSYRAVVERLGQELEKEKDADADPNRIIRMEVQYYHKDGSLLWFENIVSGIRDENGAPIGIHGISRDITDKKQTEDQLRQYKQILEELVERRTKELSAANEKLRKEITERKNKEVEIEKRKKDLEEMNAALKVLLRKREEDKSDLEEKVISNVKNLILPYLEKLKKITTANQQKTYLDIIESNYNDILSPLSFKLSSKFHGLTPTEIKIAGLIKNDATNKEMAQILGVSVKTIEFHRDRIRKKLNIKNKKINLRTYLLSLP